MTAYGGKVLEQHAAKLAASAVSPDVARERGYVSADTKAQLGRHGFSASQQLPPALVIPLWSVTGERAGAQVRPDEPRYSKGKPNKYETAFGLKMMLDIPPRVRPHLADPTRPLVITEGPLKADAIVSAGLDGIALLGVWNWRGTSDAGGKVALPDWECIALNGRQVYVCFDSDAQLNPHVHGAMGRMGALLAHRGAKVAYVYLPHGEAGAKVGADDYLAAGNAAGDLLALATSELRKPPGTETAAEPVDTFGDVADEPGWQVLDDVVAFLDRYVAWADAERRDAVALWVTHTYVYDVFDISPRLAVLSPQKQCGKTRVMELVKFLSRRARFTLTMTAAYMFRIIEDQAPTLLVDEADTIFGSRSKNDSHEDLRGLLNGGWERGAYVGRMVGEGAGMVPKDFAVFAPVALAGIGDFLPDTVLDRSVIVRMRRRAPDETVEPMRQRRAVARAIPLARRIAAWGQRHAEALAESDPAMPEGIDDRPADVWMPLIAIGDAAGGTWPARARAACVKLNAARAEDDPSISVRLLHDIRDVFATDRMHSADLVAKLNELEERPWSGWNKGNGFKPVNLAKFLADYGIRSKNVRIGDLQKKGYDFDDLRDAFDRYLPTPGTSVPTSQNECRPESMPSDQGRYGGTAGTQSRDGGTGDGLTDVPTGNGHHPDRVVEIF